MLKFDGNTKFFNDYVELLVNRVTHSVMSVERDLGDPDDSKNAIKLKDNMRAFKMLLNNLGTDHYLSEELIENIGNIINSDSDYISNGFRVPERTYDQYIAGTNIPISEPANIRNDIEKLIDRYYNDWKEMDPFEREARFHIDFIRIHPFEDGNGRTGRLLLNYNLLSKGIEPVIITTELVDYYQDYIARGDVEGMTNLFRIQSRREKDAFIELAKRYETEKYNIHR